MIVFVGCSYTWGSGLQYEYLQDKGWSVDEINKVLPDNYHLENLLLEHTQMVVLIYQQYDLVLITFIG